MARKKIVLIIVEGPSDASALERYFVKYFDSDRIVTKIIHGDITTDRNIDQSKIKAHLGNKIKSWIIKDKFKKSDIDRIIHIVDMDGAYIGDNLIQLDESCEDPYYSTLSIKTSNVEKIRLRNIQKRENLNTLSTNTSGIYNGISYNIYYMSCNLDHLLYNLQNASDEEKEEHALEFSERYIDNINDFISFLCHSKFSCCESYEDSWNFIKKDKHSLEQYSNLGLCFLSTES